MRYISYFTGIVFLLFALVQINDPDPMLWIMAYMLPAIVAFVNPSKSIDKKLLLGLAALYLIGAFILFPPSMQDWVNAEEQARSISMTLPGIEEARESMGLLLCALALIFFAIKK